MGRLVAATLKCGRMRRSKYPDSKVCPQCGGTFHRSTYRASNWPRVKFCGLTCYNAAKRYTPEQRAAVFWSRTDRVGECMVHRGCKDKWGYAHIAVWGRRVQAHRYAYEMKVGSIPAGMLVMHTCDNPPCVNPEHLKLGTDLDNTRDKLLKRRHDNITRPKLTPEKVKAIRREYWYKNKRSNAKELAAKYGVGHGTIVQAANGATWENVK